MAKRFIDTNIFNDEWFCELSKDCKLFFLYYITTCDHAGVLRLNKRLCEFQTKLKSIETLLKELDNCLVTVKEGVYFMPRFILYQYPNFPQSTVMQQHGAIKILKSLDLWDYDLNSFKTLNKELGNPNVNVNDNVIVLDVISDRIEKFKESLFPYTKKMGGAYSTEMVKDFFDYWSELNKSGTKMRWEFQKTWDIKKRLNRWASNDFGKKPKEQEMDAATIGILKAMGKL